MARRPVRRGGGVSILDRRASTGRIIIWQSIEQALQGVVRIFPILPEWIKRTAIARMPGMLVPVEKLVVNRCSVDENLRIRIRVACLILWLR